MMSSTHLPDLPSELLYQILGSLSDKALLAVCHVCHSLRVHALQRLPLAYGPGPVHRLECEDFYALVYDRSKYERYKDPTDPDDLVEFMTHYNHEDGYLYEISVRSLLQLRKAFLQKQHEDSWKEALALTAQGRTNEATHYYNSLSPEKSESDRVRLRRFSAMCRFGPLRYDLKGNFGYVALRNCMENAATRGDLATMTYLHCNWDVEWRHSIRALVRSGHLLLLHVMHYGNNVDVLSETSRRSINDAIKRGHSKTIRFLLRLGLHVGTADEDSPLSTALNYGRITILKMMLEQDTSWASSFTPEGELLIPTGLRRWDDDSSYYPAIVSFLIKEVNVNIDAVDCHGSSIIHYAVSLGIMPLLETVLEEHPDTSIPDRNGRTALQLAIEGDVPDALTLLQSHEPSDCPHNHGPA